MIAYTSRSTSTFQGVILKIVYGIDVGADDERLAIATAALETVLQRFWGDAFLGPASTKGTDQRDQMGHIDPGKACQQASHEEGAGSTSIPFYQRVFALPRQAQESSP